MYTLCLNVWPSKKTSKNREDLLISHWNANPILPTVNHSCMKSLIAAITIESRHIPLQETHSIQENILPFTTGKNTSHYTTLSNWNRCYVMYCNTKSISSISNTINTNVMEIIYFTLGLPYKSYSHCGVSISAGPVPGHVARFGLA